MPPDPAISMAYEPAERGLMRRPPRNIKTQKLVSAVMMQFTYLQLGVLQVLAGFFTYFAVMSDNGFDPARLVSFWVLH
jgi:sodium/potassium-transporting ATPase subunit alpha